MKNLIHDLGGEEFTRQVEEEFAHIATLGNDPQRAEFDRIAAYFTPPPFETGLSDEVDRSDPDFALWRSEEHTSELQSLMRTSYAVFCLKKKKDTNAITE